MLYEVITRLPVDAVHDDCTVLKVSLEVALEQLWVTDEVIRVKAFPRLSSIHIRFLENNLVHLVVREIATRKEMFKLVRQ